MKKTFTINISGIIFHIDDDAYAKLNAYLASIKSHFKNLEGRDEIIADIESRIAEILQSKLNDTKEVIVMEDVNDVIARMGEPSEFAEEDTEYSYENISNGYKRLYRDAENKMVGGVASGIAAYFHIDPVWVRLLFVVSIFTTIGPFIYLILWIAVPEALTTKERLEMKGERVTISNIEKSMREEFENLKERFNDLGEQAKKSYEKTSPQAKNTFESILSAFGVLFSFLGRGLVIFIGILLLIIGFSLTIGFMAGIFGFSGIISVGPHGIESFPLGDIFEIFLSASSNVGLVKVGLFLLLVIPVLMLIYHGIRFIIGFERIKGLGTTAGILWVIGLIFTLTFAYKIAENLRYEVTDTQSIQIVDEQSSILYLHLNELNDFNRYDFDDLLEIDDLEIAITDDAYYINQAKLEVLPSRDNRLELLRHSSARGSSGRNAKEKAEELIYTFRQDGNQLYFNEFYGFPKEIPWCDPELDLELRVPVGTIVVLDKNIHYIMMTRYGSGYYRYWADDVYRMTEDGLEALDEEEQRKFKTGKNQISKMNTFR